MPSVGACAPTACRRTPHVTGWVYMLDVKVLTPNDWRVLREIRLTALSESPEMFLSIYEQEAGYDESKWQSEFTRGDWYVGMAAPESPDKPVSVLGITREPDSPDHHCFLE